MKLILNYSMSLESIEEMIPFEREVYVALILEELEKKKQQNGVT